MRVLMLCFGPAGKGTYWRALHLARGLAVRGHTVVVCSTSRTRRLRLASRPDVQPGVTLVESPDLLWGGLRSGWDLWNVLRRLLWSLGQQFDLVHAFESRPTAIVPALYWQRCRKRRLVLDWCDWFGRGGSVEERPSRLVRALLRPVETFFEESFRSWADGTTVINSVLKHKAAALGVTPETILHLPNGCNVDELQSIPRSEARRALGWPDDLLVIGYVGAIFWRDAALMAEAFDRVYAAEPQARLLLVGYFNQPLEQMVAAPHAVWRSGGIDYDKISLYLSACDVCWLPLTDSGANRGRFPLKLSDYMAVGRPVVSTRVGDVADRIDRGGFGLTAADEPEDLAGHVLQLLRDPERREVMGRRSRRMAESEFRWEQISATLEQYYEQVLDRPADRPASAGTAMRTEG